MNNSTSIINIENHRSRERIKNMGEVFTPEQYVQQMLDLFDKKTWSDENVIFFEPSCGHGNIVVPILERRINSLNRKYQKGKLDKPILHAVANALNTLWAIDICAKNIELTRKRAFELVLKTIHSSNFGLHQVKARNFIAHIICTLLWQIHENEALSSLSDDINAYTQASKTKLGREWIKNNKHKPINFDLDWCEYYKQSIKQNITPLAYQRALRFVKASVESSNIRGFEEFNFAKEVLQNFTIKPNARTLETGVA